jgi:hypothetical protein
MRRVVTKIRPTGGFAGALHLALTVALPILIYIFVRIDLPQLAIVTILLSKWRMFAVRPRYWLANLQANAVDLLVGISIIMFMAQANSQLGQLIWMAVYATWLLLIKPGASLFATSVQALLAELAGLMAIYLAWSGAPTALLVIATWAVCYVSARHFFTSFDEPYTKFMTNIWALFGASLAWLNSHWLLYYGIVAQPSLLLIVVSYSLATIYYLDKSDRLSPLLKRQFLFIMIAIILVVLVLSDWGDKAV